MNRKKLYAAFAGVTVIMQIAMARPGEPFFHTIGLIGVSWLISVLLWELVIWVAR